MARRSKQLSMSDEEANRLLKTWSDKGDTEAAIIAGSYIEDRLGFAIKCCFIKLPETGAVTKQLTEAALFDGYGP